MSAQNIKKDLKKLENKKQAKILQGFFKTGKGQYGEGDVFLGIKVPVQRTVAIKYKDLPLKEIKQLLQSKIHEHRLVALLILVNQFERNIEKEKIFNFYLKNAKNVNNWDLVDLSAPYIVSKYLFDKKKDILYKLAKSKNLWERRISILGTFYSIRNGQFKDALKIFEMHLKDNHDLIHKAVGWMLREIGKKDQKTLETFLKKHYKNMPRTMLRYSIERLPETKRKAYLNGKI
ncbi:DNA alkylation repair protein [Nanoarchaeota archaeon]